MFFLLFNVLQSIVFKIVIQYEEIPVALHRRDQKDVSPGNVSTGVITNVNDDYDLRSLSRDMSQNELKEGEGFVCCNHCTKQHISSTSQAHKISY